MVPSFRHGEIVRVSSLPEDANPKDSWVLGVTGRVHAPSGPNEAATGWCYCVWIPEPGAQTAEDEQLWIFEEANLTSCGTVATETGLVPTEEVPLPPEIEDEISMRLVTSETDAARAETVAADVRSAITQLLPGARLMIDAKKHWHEPFYYEPMATITANDSWAAISALKTAGGNGWEQLDDDGWQVDGWWSRRSDGDLFLAAAVEHAAVVLQQWSTPRRRPPSKRLEAVSPSQRTS